MGNENSKAARGRLFNEQDVDDENSEREGEQRDRMQPFIVSWEFWNPQAPRPVGLMFTETNEWFKREHGRFSSTCSF